MKKNRKLNLNKETIARLNNKSMFEVKGKGVFSELIGCQPSWQAVCCYNTASCKPSPQTDTGGCSAASEATCQP
jgi:hypothetical protein